MTLGLKFLYLMQLCPGIYVSKTFWSHCVKKSNCIHKQIHKFLTQPSIYETMRLHTAWLRFHLSQTNHTLIHTLSLSHTHAHTHSDKEQSSLHPRTLMNVYIHA